MHYCWSDKRAHIALSSPVYWMLADSSLVQGICTIIIIHIVRSCKRKAIMMIIWWTDLDEKGWYELDLSCFCKYDEFIVPDSAYYEVNIFAMTFRDYSCFACLISYEFIMVYLACQHAIKMVVMWYDRVVSSFEWFEWLDLAHVTHVVETKST